ncbi:MAG: tetratricopeptide repeat protein [Bacteroidales bacterium]|nr:tetratricopeptide repeat protein [Bacteroidales bacterium]MDD4672803.1 tetratricopeptide repeat protein [Bacteroidales bacterium]MDY0347718.1 tetratricopeptide repeat protein [Tenuifilaceae bacterium]
MLSKRILLVVLTALSIITLNVNAQETSQYTHPDKHLSEGVNLFQKGNFVAAQNEFIAASKLANRNEVHVKGEAEFYIALCAIELFNADAEYLMRTFINHYPDNQKVNVGHFELAKLRYREKKYADAIYWFGETNRNGLNSEQKSEYFFKLGYSHFMRKDMELASRNFYELKDTKNMYSAPATYYYSHIAYQQKNYATALKGFEKLSNDETFAPVVPYYITQIYYLQRKYDRVIEYAPPILESANAKRAPEIARLISESHYRLKQYEQAIPFVEQFIEKASTLTRKDNYLIGFIYYRNFKFEEAIKHLERVATEEDTLSQNAYYHLADCYIKTNQKAKARQAFAMASKYDFDMSIKEDALFNFAKITYETLYNPFNEAIEAFNRYIELFPKSNRIDDAYNYLVQAYTNTKNYREALESLEKISNKDATIRRAYQRVAFFRGIELFQNLNFEEAVEKFTIALKYPEYNEKLLALSLYWRAESYYRLLDFQNSANDYSQFLLSPGAFGLTEYNMAHYNLGYSHFKLKNYDEAIVWFRKYTTLTAKNKTQFLGDAHNRIADSYFISRSYWVALDYYENAIKTNTIDVDYALLQRGIAFGLVSRPNKKIEELQKLVNSYPNSNYTDDALFELAETYLAINENQEAVKHYNRIRTEFPGSTYYVRALVQLGIGAYNDNDAEKAMQYYKRVVEEFPNSAEAKNALVGIRNIYVDDGNVDEYFSYASQLGSLGNVTMAEKDSLSYISAERVYMSGNCEKAVLNLNRYLDEFPKGSFVLNAHFYIADCHHRSGRLDEALESYGQVIQRQKNPFTEQTLLASSSIYMQQEKYADAYEVFNLLESLADLKSSLLDARVGMLRTAKLLERHSEVVEAANKVLITDKLPTETEREARFTKALSLLELNRNDEAFDEFAFLSNNLKSAEGAESKFRMVKIYYNAGKLDKAETEVFRFAENNTPHQYWLAKSFIILSDVYAQRDDFFQAKATLQSVIDGYTTTDDGIIDQASEKLTTLIKAEKLKQQHTKTDTIQVGWGE